MDSTFEFSPTISDCMDGEALSVAMSPVAFPNARGSRRKHSLRDIFVCRSKSEGRKLKRDEMELSFSSYAKRPISSDKEEATASAQGKPGQKNKMTDTTANRTAKREGIPVSAQELHYISGPKRRGVPVSAHELHYKANRAQAEELRKKTFLPYQQGLLGLAVFLFFSKRS